MRTRELELANRIIAGELNGQDIIGDITAQEVAFELFAQGVVQASHLQKHSLISSDDHTSTATSGKILKANTDGLPVDATNTDAEVSSAVSLSHTQGTDTTLGEMAEDIDMNGYQLVDLAAPADVGEAIRQTATITEPALEDAIDRTHDRSHSITSSSDHTSTATQNYILKADANGLPVASAYDEDDFTSATLGGRGYRVGLNVTIADATNLNVSGGSIDIAGVVYTVDEELTVALGTIVAETLYYIYADAPASGRTLAAGDFTISDTAPVFNHTYGALYKTGDATKRYIGRYFEE